MIDIELKNYITLKEYCEMHALDQSNARKKILAGKLPGQKIGREWFVDKNAILIDGRKK